MLASTLPDVLDSGQMGGWRKRLGALLLTERVQEKGWNLAQAAKQAEIDAGTIRRIERGQNYEVAKLEKYAETLGRPVESWLRETLAIPDDLIRRLTAWNRDAVQPGEAAPAAKGRRRA